MVSGSQNKRSDEELFILSKSKMRKEVKEVSRIERNIIVSGLKESGDNETDAEAADKEAVDDLVVIQMDRSNVKARLKPD
jgi:hypothetical protein